MIWSKWNRFRLNRNGFYWMASLAIRPKPEKVGSMSLQLGFMTIENYWRTQIYMNWNHPSSMISFGAKTNRFWLNRLMFIDQLSSIIKSGLSGPGRKGIFLQMAVCYVRSSIDNFDALLPNLLISLCRSVYFELSMLFFDCLWNRISPMSCIFQFNLSFSVFGWYFQTKSSLPLTVVPVG